MTKVYVMVGVGLLLIIGGIISSKISFEKGKGVIAVISAILCVFGCFIAYMGYDTFMIQPREFSITDIRPVESGYRMTIDSELKGITNGSIIITTDEAKLLGLVIENEDGNYQITDTRKITESRRWVENHRVWRWSEMKKPILKIIAHAIFAIISFILFLICFNIAFMSSEFYKMVAFGFLCLIWLYVFIFNIVLAINVTFKKWGK